jgi:hypothetical protein
MRSSTLAGSDVPAVKLRFLGTDLSDDDDERLLRQTRRALKSLYAGSDSKRAPPLVIGRPKRELRGKPGWLLLLLLLLMTRMKLCMMST